MFFRHSKSFQTDFFHMVPSLRIPCVSGWRQYMFCQLHCVMCQPHYVLSGSHSAMCQLHHALCWLHCALWIMSDTPLEMFKNFLRFFQKKIHFLNPSLIQGSGKSTSKLSSILYGHAVCRLQTYYYLALNHVAIGDGSINVDNYQKFLLCINSSSILHIICSHT